MAHGDTDLIKQTAEGLAKTTNTWAMGFGYQPGKVILAFAFRHLATGKIMASDCVINVEDVDNLIEKIRLTKIEAMRKRQ